MYTYMCLSHIYSHHNRLICLHVYVHPQVAPFLYSLGGAMGSFQMLVFACISDVTTDANRTYRLGILKIFMAFGSPTGRVVGGQVGVEDMSV